MGCWLRLCYLPFLIFSSASALRMLHFIWSGGKLAKTMVPALFPTFPYLLLCLSLEDVALHLVRWDAGGTADELELVVLEAVDVLLLVQAGHVDRCGRRLALVQTLEAGSCRLRLLYKDTSENGISITENNQCIFRANVNALHDSSANTQHNIIRATVNEKYQVNLFRAISFC